MDYRRIYLSICANAKKEMIGGLRPSSYKEKKCFKKYFEFHHVLPKSLFPRWKNRSANIVPLTAREHYFLHELACKIWPTIEMAGAWFRLSTDGRRKVTSREYERSKLEYSKYCKQRIGKNNGMFGKHWFTNNEGNNILSIDCPEGYFSGRDGKPTKIRTKLGSPEFKELCRLRASHARGRTFSDETRKKISEAKKGKPNISSGQSCKGKHFYTNGKVTVRAFECPEGFHLGRIWSLGKTQDSNT